MMLRFRWVRVSAAVVTFVGVLAGIGATGVVQPAVAGAATATPACTFNGSSLPLITNGTAGEKIAIKCTGLSPLHPYLIMEVSLLLAIDPKAAALLDGDITSVSGLLSLLNALPEINPSALAFPLSNLSGDLNYTYTLPTSQASDPNATCGPSMAQVNMGLIGCGLATIDLTTFKPAAVSDAGALVGQGGARHRGERGRCTGRDHLLVVVDAQCPRGPPRRECGCATDTDGHPDQGRHPEDHGGEHHHRHSGRLQQTDADAAFHFRGVHRALRRQR